MISLVEAKKKSELTPLDKQNMQKISPEKCILILN